MEKPTLADAVPPAFPEHVFSRARARTGRVYILDLAGFSALTERRIAEDPRLGIEQVSRQVTGFFSALSSKFDAAGLKYGGFAGDALIAASLPDTPFLEPDAFAALASAAAETASEPLAFRTGQADGLLHEAEGRPDALVPSLVWGPAVSAAFASLGRAGIVSAGSRRSDAATDADLVASASVAERWSIVARMLDGRQCASAGPDDILRIVRMCGDICEAFGGVVENVAQDDKGLLVILGLRQGADGREDHCERLAGEMSRGLSALGNGGALVRARGLLFHCRPVFSGVRRQVVFGASINRAAKSLVMARPDEPPVFRPAPAAGEDRLFVGRADELEQLRALAEESRHVPVAACLAGPAGIGKSALLRQFRQAQAADAVLVELTPVDGHVPLGGAVRVARACGLDAQLLASPEALLHLRRAVPDRLIIENWHWCDEDSRRLLGNLLDGRPAGLLLVSSRTSDTLPRSAAGPARMIRLGPLAQAEALELIRRTGSAAASGPDPEAVIRISEGNPFWLIQAALHGGAADAGGGLSDLLGARARHLSAGAVALWRLHCAWRTWLEPAQAAGLLAELGLEASGQDAAQLRSLGWLDGEAGAACRPAHDILADWGVSDLPASFERSLHGRVARKLHQLRAAPSRIAGHWARAGSDLRAAIFHERAAIEAGALGAHAACLQNLGDARRLAGGRIRAPSVRAARHEALSALGYWGAGRLRRAEQYLIRFSRTVAELPRRRRIRPEQLMVSFVRSEVGQFSGNAGLILSGIADGMRFSLNSPESHIASARRASFFYYLLGLARMPVRGAFARNIRAAEGRGDRRSEVSLRLSSATLCMSLCRWDQASHELMLAERAAGRTDDVQMMGTAVTLIALCALFRGEAGASLCAFQRLEQISAAQGHQLFSVWSAYGAGESHLYAGDVEAAQAATRTAEVRRRGLGDHQSSCIIEGLLAQTALALGAYGEAERRARNALRYARRLPPSNFSTLEGIAAPAEVGARLTCLAGRSPQRDALMDDGLAALKRYAAPFTLARPRLALAEGRRAQARQQPEAARRAYHRALALARTCQMGFEQDLAERALTDLETYSHA